MKAKEVVNTISQPQNDSTSRTILKTIVRKALAELMNGSSSSNVLYLYGESGTGKTHLIKQVLSDSNICKSNVKYLEVDRFIISVINALKGNALELLRSKLSRYRFLIIEDVDLYTFRQHWQIELIKAVEWVLLGDNQKLIITSRCHPLHLVGVNHKLLDRLGSGVPVKIDYPTVDEKNILIREFVHQQSISISPAAIEQICLQVPDNYHYLNGILKILSLYHGQTRSSITARTLVFRHQCNGLFICPEKIKIHIGHDN